MSTTPLASVLSSNFASPSRRIGRPRLDLLVCVMALFGCVVSHTATAQIRFTDTTGFSLPGRNSESWGQSIGDLNNDGWPDIFVNNHRDRHSFYFNNGDRTFTDRTLTVDRDSFIAGTYRSLDYHSGAFADIDADGDTDLFVQWHGLRSNSNSWCLFDCADGSFSSLWLNEGDGRLVDRGKAWQFEPPSGSISGMLVDVDRDGDLDAIQGTLNSFFVMPRTGPATFGPRQRIQKCARLYSVILSDLSGDGVLDFACLREGVFPDGIYARTPGGLVDIRDSISISPVNYVVDGVAADFDNDLDPDLFFVRGLSVANDALQPTPNSVEAFIDSARQGEIAEIRFKTAGTIDVVLSPFNKLPPKMWLGSTQLEIDVVRDQMFQLDPLDSRLHGFPAGRDGAVNLYGGYDPATGEWRIMIYPGTRAYEPAYVTVQSANQISDLQLIGASEADGALLPRMYRNDGSGFTTNTFNAGFRQPVQCVSVVAADFDNDMDVDLYLVCKRGGGNIANRAFENQGDGTFVEVPNAGGASGPVGGGWTTRKGWGDSATTADFDNDGSLDLFVSNGLTTFPVLPNAGPHKMYFGVPNGNRWIQLELVGTSSVANAQGARVVATANGVSQLREQGSGYHRFSQNHDRLHFGLGQNNSVDLQVTWPDGNIENYDNVAANRVYRVVEGAGLQPRPNGPVASFRAAGPGDECGEPYYESRLDRAVLIWKDCVTGVWSVRTAGGGKAEVRYSIDVSGSDLQSVQPRLLETQDGASVQSNNAVFDFRTAGVDVDGFDFQVANNGGSGGVCFNVGGSSNVPVLLGAQHLPVQAPISLPGLNACATSTPVGISMADVQADEASGTVTASLRLNQASSGVTSVRVFTRAKTARGGTDYFGFSRIVTIPAGVISVPVSVNLINDSTSESDEEFELRLIDAVNAQIDDAVATVTIIDDDDASTSLSIADRSVNEGQGSINITVSLSQSSSQAVQVKIFTRAGSARGGSDYFGFTRTLDFAPGQLTRTTQLVLRDDSTAEPTEQMQLRLTDPVNAGIARSQATITIQDDD